MADAAMTATFLAVIGGASLLAVTAGCPPWRAGHWRRPPA